MLRYGLAALACLAALWAAPVLGAACTVVPGDYVDADPGAAVAAAYVIEASGDPCYVTVRVLTLPGQPFDDRTPATYEENLSPLAGAPPYDKPFGCPYAPGEPVDLRDQYGTWYPGRVTDSDRYCGYDAEYWMDNQWKTFGAYDADLRPATLAMPTPEELVIIEQEAAALAACPEGGTVEDYAGDDVKHQITAEIIEKLGEATMSVFFDRTLTGETAVASDGSVHQSRYPNAARNATITPYRVDVTLCVPAVPVAETSRFSLDYSCYSDRFQTFVCQRDSSRAID